MLDSSAYPRPRPAIFSSVATFGLLIVNAVVFLIQYRLLSPDSKLRFEEGFALSPHGLQTGHIWQLFTYQFMHGGFLHIFLNSWAIFFFGRPVEAAVGSLRMLALYFLSGIVGGLVQIAGIWFFPGLFGYGSVVGASAGVFGLVAAFAVFFPNERLFLLLFFVIPIALRARTLMWLSAALAIIGILYPLMQHALYSHSPRSLRLESYIDPLFVNIGHAAHLGGLVMGFLGANWLRSKSAKRSFP